MKNDTIKTCRFMGCTVLLLLATVLIMLGTAGYALYVQSTAVTKSNTPATIITSRVEGEQPAEAAEPGLPLVPEVRHAILRLALVGAVCILVSILICGKVLNRGLREPLVQISRTLAELNRGNLAARCSGNVYDGPLAPLARQLNDVAVSWQNTLKEVVTSAEELVQTAEKMSDTSSLLVTNTRQMNQEAQVVDDAGETLSSNIETMTSTASELVVSANSVADAMKEMTLSIKSVVENCTRESQIANEATAESKKAQDVMTQLGESADKIGEVVEVIRGIADQTNLLALNATIEAASAGEAGKGFAVVAHEVKELARQSAQATEQIAGQIQGMQASTEIAVRAIEQVSRIIEEVSDIAGMITTAVQEQSATTDNISDTVTGVSEATKQMALNVGEAAVKSYEVSNNIKSVSTTAQLSESSAANADADVGGLTRIAESLQRIVAQYKKDLS